MLLASYASIDDGNFSSSNGLICVWNQAQRKKPEYVFESNTEITSAIFHKFDPKLIIGASYTGQILVWDIRTKASPVTKSAPVQKSPPGSKFHTHPVYCLDIVGSSASSNLISVSNDGSLCTWNVLNLTKPVKQLELKKVQKSDKDGDVVPKEGEDLGAICMSLEDSENNILLIGSDAGDVNKVNSLVK